MWTRAAKKGGVIEMFVAFVSGPYRSVTHDAVYQNQQSARAVARDLWAVEFAAICPHLNSAWFSDGSSENRFLNGYCEILKRCDLVVTAPGWGGSLGAIAEVEVAKANGIPVVHSIGAAVAWRERVEHERAATKKEST